MKNWRPNKEVWNKVNPKPIGKSMTYAFDREDMYKHGEAVANAVLEALMGSGIKMDNYNPVNRTVAETAWFLNQCEDGVLVFIPDEEAKE